MSRNIFISLLSPIKSLYATTCSLLLSSSDLLPAEGTADLPVERVLMSTTFGRMNQLAPSPRVHYHPGTDPLRTRMQVKGEASLAHLYGCLPGPSELQTLRRPS